MRQNYLQFLESIKPKIQNQDVHILGSGPSIKNFDYSVFQGRHVININHTYKIFKGLFTVCVDQAFLDQEDPKAPYETLIICRDLNKTNYPGIFFTNNPKFSMAPEHGVYKHSNSGISAVTIALHMGARRIFLYGFDYCLKRNDRSVEVHATDDTFNHRAKWPHIVRKNEQEVWEEKNLKERIQYFEVFPRDKIFNVINKYNESKIPYFPKITIDQMLELTDAPV